jgi:hypothetical protein
MSSLRLLSLLACGLVLGAAACDTKRSHSAGAMAPTAAPPPTATRYDTLDPKDTVESADYAAAGEALACDAATGIIGVLTQMSGTGLGVGVAWLVAGVVLAVFLRGRAGRAANAG